MFKKTLSVNNILIKTAALGIVLVAAFSMGNLSGAGTVSPAGLFDISAAHAAPPTDSGIVPCGREVDNPKTENDETDKCTLCHLALIANNLILFLFSIASITAVLMFIIAGLMYIFVGANPVAKNQAKEAAMGIVKGYMVVFTAWLIVDFILSAWGFIDPLGGTWNVVC
jgi:hypothetical protein